MNGSAKACVWMASALAGLLMTVQVAAADDRWEGIWTGRTQHGGDVAVTVLRGQVIDFRLRSAPAEVRSSEIVGDVLRFVVAPHGGTATLALTGRNTGRFDYTNKFGGSIRATVARRA